VEELVNGVATRRFYYDQAKPSAFTTLQKRKVAAAAEKTKEKRFVANDIKSWL